MPSLVLHHPTISSAVVVWLRQFIFKIPITNMILMEYLMKFQVRIITKSINYISRSIIGFMYPRKIIILQREVFFWIHLHMISTIFLLDEFRGRVGGLGYTL